jgi:channel protein (hemolysin III family)
MPSFTMTCFWKFLHAIGITRNEQGDGLDTDAPSYEEFRLAWKSHGGKLMKDGRTPFWRGTIYRTGEPKPTFRGVLHIVAAVVLMPIILWLGSLSCHSPASTAMVVIVDGIVTMLLLISGLYHRVPWPTDASCRFFRRWDYANIFLLGAASITAQSIYLTQQNNSTQQVIGVSFLVIEWIIVILGVIYSFFGKLAPPFAIDQWRMMLYGLSGALPVLFVGIFYYIETPLQFSMQLLVFALGLASVVIFERGYLDFVPDTFGTHEVFHVLVLVGVSVNCWMAHTLAAKVL